MDQSGSSVMVWKGKQASKEERREALNRAMVSLLNDTIWLRSVSGQALHITSVYYK